MNHLESRGVQRAGIFGSFLPPTSPWLQDTTRRAYHSCRVRRSSE